MGTGSAGHSRSPRDPLEQQVSSIISANCGSNVTLNATVGGNITSPNYPNDYDNNHRCAWDVRSEAGTIVELVILDFYTELDFDFLEVRVL